MITGVLTSYPQRLPQVSGEQPSGLLCRLPQAVDNCQADADGRRNGAKDNRGLMFVEPTQAGVETGGEHRKLVKFAPGKDSASA